MLPSSATSAPIVLPNDVFFALRGVDRIANDQRRDVHATSGYRIVPDRLAGARLQRPNFSVAGAKDHGCLTAQRGDGWRTVGRVVR